MAVFEAKSAMLLQLNSRLAKHSTKPSATAAPTAKPTQAFGLCEIIFFTLHKLMKCHQMWTVPNVRTCKGLACVNGAGLHKKG